MRSKTICLIALSVLAMVAVQGCGDQSKTGVPIQQGDYTHAPGGGGGGPAAHGANPGK